MTIAKSASFGAEYLPGLSLELFTPQPLLETLETLATMSWLTITNKHVASSIPAEDAIAAKDRMALVANRIPRMLHPDNPPYEIATTLPKIRNNYADGFFNMIRPDPLRVLALYSMMGLSAPSSMWPSIHPHSVIRFLKFDGFGVGYIFKFNSKICDSHVFGSYEPEGNRDTVYLFFPTLGEYLADKDDLNNELYDLEFKAMGQINYYFLCDVRKFVFE